MFYFFFPLYERSFSEDEVCVLDVSLAPEVTDAGDIRSMKPCLGCCDVFKVLIGFPYNPWLRDFPATAIFCIIPSSSISSLEPLC